MNFFRRHQAATLEPPPAGVATLLCDARGCANYTAVKCTYRDRRGRACTATFCPNHHAKVDGAVFCRRHASTIAAIGERGKDPNARPDIDDRGASLVNWISRDLDGPVRTLLNKVSQSGERVLVDGEVSLAHDVNRRARWERSWKLVESTGVIIKVTISVLEENDSLVHVRVGTEMVADGVPPWIAQRREGHELTASVDESQRRLFYRFLEENITAAVNRFRARGDKADWNAPAEGESQASAESHTSAVTS
jgi:hypothetical protein